MSSYSGRQGRARTWLLVGVAAIAVVLLGVLLNSPDERHQTRVIARLDGERRLEIAPPQEEPRKVRIGATTRTAIPALPGSAFEVRVDPLATEFIVSLGAHGLSDDANRASFVVKGLTSAGWKEVVNETLGWLRPGWLDRVVDLRSLDPPISRLRFESTVVQAPDAAAVEPYWGSILLQSSDPGWSSAALQRLGLYSERAPSVILISLDTLSAEHLSGFGGPAGVSPNLDRIFENSFSFRRAYSQYPNTPVSHASLFTGLYPIHHGVYETSPWMHSGTRTLASVLAQRGYFAAAFTENAYVSSDFGFDNGFDSYDNGVGKTLAADDTTLGNAPATFSKAKEWLAKREKDQRYLLFVHTYAVHTPYTPQDAEALAFTNSVDPDYKGEYATSFPGGLAELGNNSGTNPLSARDFKRLAALYAGEIQFLDRVVADFMAFIERAFPDDPPLVIFFADHGEEFGEHGMLAHGETLHGQALHVPLAFHWPGRIKPGRGETTVQLVDVMPTILDLFGMSSFTDLDGRSLASIISGDAERDKGGVAYAELKTAWGTCRQLRLPDDCRVNRMAVQTDHFKFITSELPKGESLYDLSVDPAEMHDIIEQNPTQADELRQRLSNYQAGVAALPSEQDQQEMDEATRERLRALGYRE